MLVEVTVLSGGLLPVPESMEACDSPDGLIDFCSVPTLDGGSVPLPSLVLFVVFPVPDGVGAVRWVPSLGEGPI